jgi:uncharacterized protein
MNTILPKYFIATVASLVLIPLLFVLSANMVKSAADHIVISEVRNNVSDEFVELFNPTDSDIDLTGWSLKRKPQDGDPETNLVSALAGEIKANGYFLIAKADTYTGTVTPDQSYSGSIGSDNTILLYDDSETNSLVDKVGFGSASDSEISPASNPGTGSIRRINNDDTDNNSVDFEVLTTSDPQNSSVIQTPIATSTVTPTATPSPTSSPTASPTPTSTPTPTASPTASPTVSPTSPPTSSPSPVNVASFFFPNTVCRMQIHYIRIGFLRMPFAMVSCQRI